MMGEAGGARNSGSRHTIAMPANGSAFGMIPRIGDIVSAAAELQAAIERLSEFRQAAADTGQTVVDWTAIGLRIVTLSAEHLGRAADAIERTLRCGTGHACNDPWGLAEDVDIDILLVELAAQARLLALNTTVDATWLCGAAGRSAAATEVTALSVRSVHAAEEIAWQAAEAQHCLVSSGSGVPVDADRAA